MSRITKQKQPPSSFPTATPTGCDTTRSWRVSVASSHQGFTLVETIITIGILIILTGIAVFQVNPAIQRYRLNGAARLVWGDLQNAKMIALKTNSSTTVSLNSSTNYSFPQGGGTTFSRDLTKEYPNISISASDGGGSVNSITFSSAGQIPTITTGNITVTVQGDAGTKTITLSWTGRIVLS